MMRHFWQHFAFALVMLTRIGWAQEDWTLMERMRQVIESNPRLRADRERNLENASQPESPRPACLWFPISRVPLATQSNGCFSYGRRPSRKSGVTRLFTYPSADSRNRLPLPRFK